MLLLKPGFEVLTKLDGHQILKKIEKIGRVCYKSEALITNDSAKKFVLARVKQGHHSIIEHENITVRFICDRGMTHCLVRHRLAAYSQESTRYCNYKGGVAFIIPYWIDVEPGEYSSVPQGDEESEAWCEAMLYSEDRYIKLLKLGWSAEKARSVLPNSLKADIVMSANLREWRHVLNLWCHKSSHRQAQELVMPLLQYFHFHIPALFDDLWEQYKSDTKFLKPESSL